MRPCRFELCPTRQRKWKLAATKSPPNRIEALISCPWYHLHREDKPGANTGTPTSPMFTINHCDRERKRRRAKEGERRSHVEPQGQPGRGKSGARAPARAGAQVEGLIGREREPGLYTASDT